VQLVCGEEAGLRTHVCGDGAGLSKDYGEVQERSRKYQTGSTHQRVGSRRLLPQLPAHLHATGHAQHACDAGDDPENQAVVGETQKSVSCLGHRSVAASGRRTSPV